MKATFIRLDYAFFAVLYPGEIVKEYFVEIMQNICCHCNFQFSESFVFILDSDNTNTIFPYNNLLFRIVPFIVPNRSIGATIGASGMIIGAIGAIFDDNNGSFGAIIGDTIYDITYDIRQLTMTFAPFSMTSNICIAISSLIIRVVSLTLQH